MTATAAAQQLVVGKSTRTTARPQGGRGPEATRQHLPATHRPSRMSWLAVQVADGRELAVLADGPWRGRWYWADDLTAIQDTSRRYPDGHPAAELRTYAPTDGFVPHPHEPEVTGRLWRHHPHPTAATTFRRTA
ncbi:hypothetical protein [Pseudonocardia sp. ICBG1142]|uniref:hypothetical protein n=1 Tax=Pseudonocardia sp. ICBG1142 TaxID=2846760 RepID=UPI001CF6DC3C|nr:hypothetical protein [Pseudonocardia sp. ICBG1142]